MCVLEPHTVSSDLAQHTLSCEGDIVMSHVLKRGDEVEICCSSNRRRERQAGALIGRILGRAIGSSASPKWLPSAFLKVRCLYLSSPINEFPAFCLLTGSLAHTGLDETKGPQVRRYTRLTYNTENTSDSASSTIPRHSSNGFGGATATRRFCS